MSKAIKVTRSALRTLWSVVSLVLTGEPEPGRVEPAEERRLAA